MVFTFDDFELDGERLELRRDGQLVKADALVLRVLAVLLQNAGQLVTKEQLVAEVWGGRAVADNVITVSMARLRKALGDRRAEREREFVATVYARGYRFVRSVVMHSSSTAPAPLVEAAVAQTPPFVGREPVLARLRRAAAEARAGRGRCCALMGEPGIGKTRVVEAFERELSGSGVRVVWGYCREAGDTPPLWPWLRLLDETLAAMPDDARGVEQVTAELRTGSRATAATDRPPGKAGDGALPGAARHRSFDALLRTLTLAAERTPLVLVLDDLHRADAASLELLNLLLDEIARSRLLVIATLRSAPGRRTPRPDTSLPQVLGHRNCERIALERLGMEEVTAYVAAVLDDRDGRLGRAVFAKSEGNPFFMTELARQLEDGDAADPGALFVPVSALELIRQRVGQLHAETREVSSVAAVIGRSFELPLLSAVLERAPAALMPAIDDAIANEVLVAAPESRTAFAFSHELLRVMLYDAHSPSERRRWHLTIGRALQQRASEGDATPPSELAYHLHAALPEGDLHETVDACRAAAAASAEVLANADVIRYARHALEALDLTERPSSRLRTSLLFMIALYARGHASGEFVRSIREVVRLSRERGDARTLVRAALLLNVHPGLPPMPGAAAALEHALSLLDPADDAGRAVALGALACSAPVCFSREQSDPLLEEAAALARKCDEPQPLQVALRARLYLHGGPAHRAEAELAAEELESLAQHHPRRLPVVPAQLAVHRAVIALQHGEPKALAAAVAHAQARCQALRERELRWHGKRFAALSRVNAGAWPEGVAELEVLHREAEQRAILGTAPFCAFDRVVVFGELAESLPLDEQLRRALDYAPSDPPGVWSMKLRALATAGLVDEARAGLRAWSKEDIVRLPCDSSYLGTLGHLSRTVLVLDALDYAESLYDLLAPHQDRFCGHVAFLCEGSVPQVLGALAHGLGRVEAARAHFEAGIAMNDRAGFAPRGAEARLQLARCLLDEGDARERARALELAREALVSAERFGMHRLLREASALVRRFSSGQPTGRA